MLIESEKQHGSNVAKHQKCSKCLESLNYPRIVVLDKHMSSYHLSCALEVMTTITHDFAGFLASPDLPKMADAIHVQKFFEEVQVERLPDPPSS